MNLHGPCCTFGSIKTLVNHEESQDQQDQLKSKEISTKTFADSCLLYKEGKPKVTSLPWE